MAARVCLVTCPLATEFEDSNDARDRQVLEAADTPQLGVLTLAAALEAAGEAPELFHLDRRYYEFLAEGSRGGLANFPAWLAERLAEQRADVYGFSTICSSYPLTIRIAEALKRRRPGAQVLLGGPQASVVDRETLEAFPFIDFVLRGEADQTLPMLMAELGGTGRLGAIPGLTYRSPFGVQRSGNAPTIEDLDSLPLPAYHLAPLAKDAPNASLELGRGCPFACTFCSTNDFFRRRFRLKSPARMLADMRAIAAQYGIRAFNLVHDMFTVDRKRVVAFCEHMLESGENFAWSCSARTDSVDDKLLALMARSGCESIFFGVETGSWRMQKIIDKGLDPEEAKRAIRESERLGIPTIVSLIIGFPEETREDLRETVEMYMQSMQCPRSDPQFNLLAPLAGTPILTQYRGELILEELCSDMSHQGAEQNEADRELIRRYPEIFPNFYNLKTPGLDRDACIELRECLLMLTAKLRWLAVAVHQHSSGILDVFDDWRAWRLQRRPGLTGGPMRRYYLQQEAKKDFVAFVRANLPRFRHASVEALVAYHEITAAMPASADTPGHRIRGKVRPGDVPVRAAGVSVIDLPWDIQAAIQALQKGTSGGRLRRRTIYRTGAEEDGQRRLFEVTPLVGRALAACDGQRTVAEMVATVADAFTCTPDLHTYAGECLVEELRSARLIEVRRR